MKVSRTIKIVLAFLFIMSLKVNGQHQKCKNSEFILQKLIRSHDPLNNWPKAKINIHLEEPRVGNPKRYTRLMLDNAKKFFQMERKRDEGIVKRVFQTDGSVLITIEGLDKISNELKEKYALNAQRTKDFQNFYTVLIGAPMSFADLSFIKTEPAITKKYQEKDVYALAVELENEIISKNWTLIISEAMDEILALEFNYPNHPEREEEIIKYEGELVVDGIKFPRMRHWHLKDSGEYLGSDLIIGELD